MSDFLSNGIDGYLQKNNSYDNYAKELSEKLTSKDYSNASDEELMEACKSFEKYFIEQVMKGMEKTIPKDENESSGASYKNMFMDNLYQEYADKAANIDGGLGIAQKLYEQMKRNYNL